MQTLREILDSSPGTASFPLIGTTIEVPEERVRYAAYIRQYHDLAIDAAVKLGNYLNQMSSFADLIENLAEAFLLSIEDAVNAAAADAVSVGHITLDPSKIITDCLERGWFNPFVTVYQSFLQADQRITGQLADAAAYREQRKQARGRWTSATWGGNAMDAWENELQAEGMNLIEGAGHSLINFIGNSIDASNAEAERQRIFENEDNRNRLINGTYESGLHVAAYLLAYLKEAEQLTFAGSIAEGDTEKALSICRNLTKLNLDREKQQEFVREVFRYDPFCEEVYQLLLQPCLEAAGELTALRTFFSVEIPNGAVYNALLQYADANIGNSPEEYAVCKRQLLAYAEQLDYDAQAIVSGMEIVASNRLQEQAKGAAHNTAEELIAARSRIAEDAQKMELTAGQVKPAYQTLETYAVKYLKAQAKGAAHKTEEELIAARGLIEKDAQKLGLNAGQAKPAYQILEAYAVEYLCDLIKERLGTTEEQAQQCRALVTESAGRMQLSKDITARLLEPIDEQIRRLDEEYRTVDGMVLETREAADSTRTVLQGNRTLLENPPEFTLRSDFVAYENYINSLPMDPAIRDKYLKAHHGKLEKFDEKCALAARWEHRQKHGRFNNGCTVSMVTQYAILAFLLYSFVRSIILSYGILIYIGAVVMIALDCFYIFMVSPGEEKKAWEELMQNGMLPLPVITGNAAMQGIGCCAGCGISNAPGSTECRVCRSGDPFAVPLAAAPNPLIRGEKIGGNSAQKAVMWVVLGVISLFFLSGLGELFGAGTRSSVKTYRSQNAVVDAFASAMTKADGSAVYVMISPERQLTYVTDAQKKSLSDTIALTNAMLEGMYEKKPVYKMEIVDSTTIDITEITALYGTAVDVRKACRCTVELEVCKDTDTITLDLFEIKGEGWKISSRSVSRFLGG